MCRGHFKYQHSEHPYHHGHHRRHRNHRRHHNRPWGRKWEREHPSANVVELDDAFELKLYAAGYEKEDFMVGVRDNILVIKSQARDWDEDQRWRRLEFERRGFKRKFGLDDRIDQESIVASYEDGVLTVVLPKKEGMETSSFKVDVN